MQSLYNKRDTLEAFIHQDTTYQALCITETWLTPQKLAMIQLSNYKLAASFCRKFRTGGGVCIFLQDNLEYIEKEEIAKMSIEYVMEVCAVELPKENILLLTIYWNRREEELFYKQIKLILKHINDKYSKYNIIIGGDLNINILQKNIKSNKLIDLMSEYNFTQHIKGPTHVTSNVATCLDLIFTNFNTINLHTTIEDLGFSDHMGTVINMNIRQNHTRKVKWIIKKRIFNSKNIDKFKSELYTINWDSVLKHDLNINQNYNSFLHTLKTILNKCIPQQTIKLKCHYKKHWLTVGIRNSCKHKRLLKIISSKYNNSTLNQHYKIYEKTLKKTIITAKKLEYINKISKSTNKVKAMWSIVHERTNKKTVKDKQNIKLNLNNNLITDPQLIADSFSDFFASIGQSPNANCKTGRPVLHSTENSLFLNPVTPTEINKIIKKLKSKLSHGIDELPPVLIRQCADELTEPFCYLINQSFREGVFPDLLKVSIIKPIHKKNTKTDINNYRPISLLPTAAKIFEKAMSDRVYKFCEKYKIFNESQNGFRKNRSTTLAIYKFIQEAYNLINNKQYAIGILLDMTKAYDTVQYKILLNKLHGIGIRGLCHKWFESYLQKREQFVEIEYFDYQLKTISKIRSKRTAINGSIPQGSVLGCLLFLIYINDLADAIDHPCVMFADDVSILTSSQNSVGVNEKLRMIMTKTEKWMDEHNLQINFSKTNLLTFHPYQKAPIEINFNFNNVKIEQIKEHTLLGLIIDQNLNWKSHLNKLRNKISSFAYALNETKKTTDIKTAIATYYAYAYAWFSYGILLWGNSTDFSTLFTLQKKLIRIIANIDQTDSCKPYFQKYQILPLPCIYILEIFKFVRKYPNFYTKRKDLTATYQLRHKNKLNLPDSRMSLHANSPYVMSIKIYNKLPEKIKEEADNKKFIKIVKELLMKKAYYTVKEFLSDKL